MWEEIEEQDCWAGGKNMRDRTNSRKMKFRSWKDLFTLCPPPPAIFHTVAFLSYKTPYPSYPQEHYLINSFQQETHTSLQYNSNRHFVIWNILEIALPLPLHSGVILCVIMKKNCRKQIEKCNNRFAAHDLHEGYPDSTTALLIMMIQIKFLLRLISISLHPTIKEIWKETTYYLSVQNSSSKQPLSDQWYLFDNFPLSTNCWWALY